MDSFSQFLRLVPLQEAPAKVEDGFSPLGLISLLVLVAMNGFFVAAEFALVSARQTRLAQLEAEGNSTAKAVQKAQSHLDRYIATTQLGITLASLALGWVGEPALASLIEPPLISLLGKALGEGFATGISIAIAFIFITTITIIMGELVPKSVALQRTEGTALFVIRPLNLFMNVFYPFIWLLNRLGRFVMRLLGLKEEIERSQVHSVEELEMLVTQSHQAGMLDANEEALLHKVFEFDDKTARQIMMPRTEIVGVPEDVTLDELLDKVSQESFTRYPVYRETLDQIIGVIHIKDLFPLIRKQGRQLTQTNGASAASGTTNGNNKHLTQAQNGDGKIPLSRIIRPALNVPESIHVADLLNQLRQKQAHIAVVIDEYGGTSGIVTLEDVLEELVGEVQDEFDVKEEDATTDIEIRPDGSAIISGLVTLETIEDRFGVTIPEEQADIFDTIGGYVLGVLGRVPVVGDQVRLENYKLTVQRMDGLRVDRLLIERANQKPPAEQNQSL